MDECQNVIAFDDFDAIGDATENTTTNMGQSESKKAAKKLGPETKGTAMSFGFKKKIYSTSKRNGNSIKEKEKLSQQEVGAIRTDNADGDDNGNTGSSDLVGDRETGRTTPRLTPPRKESTGAPYRSIRFGFRQANVVRPASVGLNPKVTSFDTVSNNNFTAKPRSKSECSRPTITNQLNNKPPSRNAVNRDNPKINACSTSTTVNITYQHLQQQQQQQQQLQHHQSKNKNMPTMHQQHQTNTATDFDYTNKPPSGKQLTVVNTGMHTNEIIRPIPKSAEFVSKFTLHTSSLPQPQYPVPISLASRNVMDTKVAKQAANTTRRGFFCGRDVSSDSGISSMETYAPYGHVSPKRNRNRPRNLEMVINGRHKFEVRDLESELMDENVVPLSLPKLPSIFNNNNQPAPISGLHRNDSLNDESTESFTDGVNLSFRKSSLTSLDVESIEEEKLFRDNSMTEKGARNSVFKEYSPSSKTSSPASSRASWCNAGESMAFKDCSSISVSSSESVNNKESDGKTLSVDLQDHDLGMAIDMDKTFSSSISPPTSLKIDVVDYHNAFKNKNISNELTVAIEDIKFAQITEAAGDVFIDDETSPIDSLMSSCDSDEIMTKKNKKKINDSIKGKNIIDESMPMLDFSSPLSPGSPTHASNSLSLSDGDVGRDFLIDDEIADQPALCFSDKHEVTASNPQLLSLTDTPTLMETTSCASLKKHSQASRVYSNNSYAPQIKPRQSLLSRTESLDTLSPCESIASDDLMMDYEYNSSIDSLDRMPQSVHSGRDSALHSLDHTQLYSELEAKESPEMMREWNSIFKTARMLSRDSMTSHLPARATRLLNRSRVQQSNAGSDSPRSLDSFQRRTPSNRPSPQLTRDSNGSPDDNILNESLRNIMLDDILDFKKQLIRLRNVLQEPEGETLMSSDTLNPFEINGQFFGSGELTNDAYIENKDLYNYSKAQDDAKQELLDLRRQVVYLQSQLDDKDRTIKIQQNMIQKLETDAVKFVSGVEQQLIPAFDTMNSATQTERLRSLPIGQDGTRLEDEDYAALSKPTNISSSKKQIQSHHPTVLNGLSNKLSSQQKMLFPIKTVRNSVTTNHQTNSVPKTNGNNVATEYQAKSPTISPRRIPRLIRQTNDGLNHNLLNDNTSSYKLQNGINGHHIFDDLNSPNSKECNLKLFENTNRQNGQVNGNSSKVDRMRNLSVLKSPHFTTRIRSEDE